MLRTTPASGDREVAGPSRTGDLTVAARHRPGAITVLKTPTFLVVTGLIAAAALVHGAVTQSVPWSYSVTDARNPHAARNREREPSPSGDGQCCFRRYHRAACACRRPADNGDVCTNLCSTRQRLCSDASGARHKPDFIG